MATGVQRGKGGGTLRSLENPPGPLGHLGNLLLCPSMQGRGVRGSHDDVSVNEDHLVLRNGNQGGSSETGAFLRNSQKLNGI